MATLTTQDRNETVGEYMRENTSIFSTSGSSKPLLYQTIAAIDRWMLRDFPKIT